MFMIMEHLISHGEARRASLTMTIYIVKTKLIRSKSNKQLSMFSKPLSFVKMEFHNGMEWKCILQTFVTWSF